MSNKANNPKIIIVGGGFAGLTALHHLTHHLGGKADITLIDKNADSVNRPTMPEVAFDGKPVAHSLFPLKRAVGHHAKFVQGTVRSVEPEKNQVNLKGGKSFKYDYLILTPGPIHAFSSVAGLEEFGYSVCDEAHATHLWKSLQDFVGRDIVIGSAPTSHGTRVKAPVLLAACEGPIGEAMFMMDHYLRHEKQRDDHNIRVFSPPEIFFEDVGPKVREGVGALIAKAGIQVTTGKVIAEVANDHVKFSDGEEWPSDFTIVLPPHAPPAFIAHSGLGDDAGWLPTDTGMKHLDYDNIFAAGDSTALAQPKLGHIAAIQGEIAAKSVIQKLGHRIEVPDYKPEVLCIMNRGGFEASLILTDTLFGGDRDIVVNGKLPHMLKWSFDAYVGYTHGHLPPKISEDAMKTILDHMK